MAQTEKQAALEEDQSMEEILQSIRRIIAEDEDDGATPPPAADDSDLLRPAKGSDVLELTDMITDDGSVVHVDVDDVLDLTQEVADDTAPAIDILSNIDSALGQPAATALDPFDALLSQESAQAASSALKGLKKPAVPGVDTSYNGPAFRSGVTVEDLMIEALRPMLKSWLDANLPRVVERIVEREVKKLTQE